MIDLETLLQFGIAGIALYMMYRMMTNDLKSIQEELEKVVEVLTDIKKILEAN